MALALALATIQMATLHASHPTLHASHPTLHASHPTLHVLSPSGELEGTTLYQFIITSNR